MTTATARGPHAHYEASLAPLKILSLMPKAMLITGIAAGALISQREPL